MCDIDFGTNPNEPARVTDVHGSTRRLAEQLRDRLSVLRSSTWFRAASCCASPTKPRGWSMSKGCRYARGVAAAGVGRLGTPKTDG